MDTERSFRRALRAIGGPRRPKSVPGGRWVLVPSSGDYPMRPIGAPKLRGTAAERRRRNLSSLAAFVIVTFLIGLFVQPLRFLLWINIVADGLFVLYLVATLLVAPRSASEPGRVRADEASMRRRTEAAGGGW